MFRLIGLAASIGLADSLNPSTVGPALLLASGERPIRSVLRFTLGTFVVFLLGGAILTVGPGQAILALIPHPGATARYVLETVAGAAMVVVSAVLWVRRQELGRHETHERHSRRRAPFLLGATISLVELPTAFPYFAVIVAVVGSGYSVVSQLLLILLYNVCFVLPLVGIAALLRIVGPRATEVLRRVRAWLHQRWPVLVAAVALLAGVFVLALGITGLTSGVHGRVGRVSRRLRKIISR
jgi:cytochrome c biogenesis protein CcdA